MNGPRTRCPICGKDYDDGDGLPAVLPEKCVRCNWPLDRDGLVDEDADVAWDY